jgi:hypothetical protein
MIGRLLVQIAVGFLTRAFERFEKMYEGEQ